MTAPALLAVPEAKAETLRRLSAINRALTYTTSMEAAGRLAVSGASELLNATKAVLMLQGMDGLLHVRAAFGITDDRVGRFRTPLADDVITRLRGLLDVGGDRFLAVPLIVGGQVTGIIAVGRVEAASEADEWLLSALADQVALGLETARLGGEVRLEMEGRLRASEGATDAKDRALTTLAHDIRTPLGAIDGYCTLIEDGLYGPVTDGQLEALARVRMSGRHLLSLLDNVMDLARLSAGRLDIRCGPVHLLDTARDAIAMVLPAAEAKQQRLTVAGDDVVAYADAPRVRQILVNLIGNAVKFTPAGGQVTVTVLFQSGDHPRGAVRVSDTGPGIDAAEQRAIFEAYYRSDGTRALPGIGLGLAISAGLVAQMGGELTVESALGAGATFVVALPVLGPRGVRDEVVA